MRENLRKTIRSIYTHPFELLIYFFIIAASLALLSGPYYKFAILPSLLVLFFFFLARYPHIGFLLLIFLFPFEKLTALYRIQGFGTLSPQKLIGFSLIIILFFTFIFTKKSMATIKSNLWPWLLLFFAINFFSAILSDYKETSFEIIRQLVTSYIMFTLTLSFINSKSFKITFSSVIIWSVLLMFLITVLESILLPANIASMEMALKAYKLEMPPKAYSLFFVFCMPFLAHRFFYSDRIFSKITSLVLFLIMVSGVIFGYARAGLVMLIYILVVLSIKYIRRLKPKYMGITSAFAVFIIIAIIIFVPQSYWERQETITNIQTDESIVSRHSYLIVGWDAIKKNPVIGSGPGTFKEIYKTTGYSVDRLLRMGLEEGQARHAHNTYLEVAVGTGILGFLVFSIIILIALRNFLRARKLFSLNGEKKMASLTGDYMLSFVSILIFINFLSDFSHHYLWISLALSQVALKISQDSSIQESNNSLHDNKYGKIN